MTKAKERLVRCVICAAFAAVICVLSPFAIPAAVPVTLATLGVYIAAGCLPPSMSAAAVAVYLAVGALGAPVFSGFAGGVAHLAGPTGGYLVGYLPMAAAISALISLRRRRERAKNPAALGDSSRNVSTARDNGAAQEGEQARKPDTRNDTPRNGEQEGKRPPLALDIAFCAAAMIAGTVVLYALGTAWFVVSQKTTLAAAIPTCVLPFLPGDAAKIAAAAIVSRAIEPVVGRAMG